MELTTSLKYLSGVGPAIAKRLERLELFTVEDLINHYPFRYDDFSKISKISEAKFGDTVTFKGDVWAIKNTYTRFRRVLTKATLNDGSGSIELVWFNQPWLIKNLKVGDKIQVSAKVDRSGSKLTLVSPEWEKVTPTPEVEDFKPRELGLHTGRLVPIYPETYGINSKWLRIKIAAVLPHALPQIEDPIPDFIQQNLLPLSKAIEQIHFPQKFDQSK
ncbi:MAG: OB-fold nucleic acid binding domain-containing protein [bacterium]|nr:OB-fold nucleic acid binding domain-containing protein [bacterium]